MTTTPRTALVTGAGSGIGAATARRLARDGLRTALLGRTRAKLDATARAILADGGLEPVVLVAHQERDDEVTAAVSHALEELGRIDVLVNNAAIYEPGGVCDTEIERWDEMLDVNLRGPLLVSRAVVPHQRASGGVIVNVSSTLGLRPIAGFSHYAVSKAALIMLTKCLALEEAAHGIRALAICPGVVSTPIHGPQSTEAEFAETMGALHPLGRVGTAEEVADLIAYVASDKASWMTGSVITIDGGIALG